MKLEELGRRAVACKRWRWMPGMLSRRPSSVGVDICHRYGEAEWPANPHDNEYPDFSDPATLGCLLHLVREVTGAQSSSPSWYPGGKHDYPHWAWYSDSCYGKLCEGSTEAECLVKVLEYKQ